MVPAFSQVEAGRTVRARSPLLTPCTPSANQSQQGFGAGWGEGRGRALREVVTALDTSCSTWLRPKWVTTANPHLDGRL